MRIEEGKAAEEEELRGREGVVGVVEPQSLVLLLLTHILPVRDLWTLVGALSEASPAYDGPQGLVLHPLVQSTDPPLVVHTVEQDLRWGRSGVGVCGPNDCIFWLGLGFGIETCVRR